MKVVYLLSVDKGRIIQVITNLISNAIAFTKKGVISITKETRMEEDGSSVIVTLKDTGSGIDLQILPRLFTKFTTNLRKAPDWDCIFVSASLKLMEVRYGVEIMMMKERHLVSACQLLQ